MKLNKWTKEDWKMFLAVIIMITSAATFGMVMYVSFAASFA